MTEEQELQLFKEIGTFVEKVNNLTGIVEKNTEDISGLRKFQWMILGALALASTGVFATLIRVFVVNV